MYNLSRGLIKAMKENKLLPVTFREHMYGEIVQTDARITHS